jgi:signal transduction histidine kinase
MFGVREEAVGEVQVSANGPALPQETLRVLFDPFALRGDTPLEYGIHLMACYFIVHHHGGRITARSEEGQGTTFTLCLPTNPARAKHSQSDPQLLEKVQLGESLWENLISSN